MTTRTFATALRAAREATGLSQAALGRKAGLTGSYVCLLESRRKRPPSPRVVGALCRALGIPEEPLQDLAALERAPAGVRKRLERLDRERGRAVRARDRVLTTTLFHIAHRPTVTNPLGVGEFPLLPPVPHGLLARLVRRVRRARTVEEAVEDADDILGETSPQERETLAAVLPQVLARHAPGPEREGAAPGAPPAPEPAPPAPVPAPRRLPLRERLAGPEVPGPGLLVDPSLASDAAFLWRVAGDDAWPRVEPGDLVVVEPDATPAPGDLVAFEDGGADRLRTFQVQGGEARLLSPRPDVPPVRRPLGAFRPSGVVRAVLRALR